ncbi:hypothetical protein GQX74_004911 [Glossina fuscipes]|nr:hypothetical protein GQX74_004911 [Glossina fuscipes]
MALRIRSQSRAALQRDIEMPPDTDDGLSNQDADPELSNSSSEMWKKFDSLAFSEVDVKFFKDIDVDIDDDRIKLIENK